LKGARSLSISPPAENKKTTEPSLLGKAFVACNYHY
jgi:hypothetical protein